MVFSWMSARASSLEAPVALDVASGPVTPGHSSAGLSEQALAKAPAQQEEELEEEDSAPPAEEPWWELDMLKANLKALNAQLFEERKQWLAEKTELEKAASLGTMACSASSAHFSHASSGALLSSPVSSTGAGGGGGGGRSFREGALASQRSMSSAGAMSSDDPAVLRAHAQALQGALSVTVAERDSLKQELCRCQAEAQRWNVERVALQREVEVLRQQAAAGGGRSALEGGGDEAAWAALEEERAALASELELIKSSLKGNVLVPRAHVAALNSSMGGGASRANGGATLLTSASSGSLAARSPIPSVNSVGREQDPQAVIAKLNAEITRLQADMFILKDECVPVPKADFAQLKGVHSDKVNMEQELRAVRQELADVTRLNKMLREEMELIKEHHVAITVQEYDELRRSSAEKQALELKVQAEAKYYAQVPKEELAEMQAARRGVAALEARVAAMQAVVAMSADDTSSALQRASHEVADLRIKLRERDGELAELRKEVEAGAGRAAAIAELQDKLRAADAGMQAVQQERARLQLVVRALQEEVDAAKSAMKEAQAESAQLAVDLAQRKDQGSALAQDVSRLSRERGELEARVVEFKDDHTALTNELVEAKLELARLREMEVLYKRSVLSSKKQLYGLPSAALAEHA